MDLRTLPLSSSPASCPATLHVAGVRLYWACVTTDLGKTEAIVSKLVKWYPQNARDLPWRRTSDPYAVFVSEVMLQQTQVKTVIPYWQRWMQHLPDIQSLARAHPDQIHKLWEGLGYYHRVRNLQRAAREIMEKHRGEFPREFNSILALPGIGRYTAGAICSIAFNQPKPILDGNVIRVLARLYGITRDTSKPAAREQLWRLSEQLVQAAVEQVFEPALCKFDARASGLGLQTSVPHARRSAQLRVRGGEFRSCSAFNQSLMELGALICTHRAPNCVACPVSAHCVALHANVVNELPRCSPRPATTTRRFVAFVVEERGRILVRKRPEDQVNGGLWELPNIEIAGGSQRHPATLNPLGLVLLTPKPLCRIRHSITRYRVVTEAFPAKAPPRLRTSSTDRWIPRKDLHRLAFPSAHKKIIEMLKTRK